MLLPPNIDWLSWAGRFNQLSLLPFLAFLWTISRIPDAPKRTIHGWYLYILFVAVAIPAGIYSKTHLGTSMANVDWIHGPCELLLTLANLFIVLGLRDALRAATAAKETSSSTANTLPAPKEGKGTPQHTQQQQQDPLSDMQYLQQLHSMYSSKHNPEGSSTAAAGGSQESPMALGDNVSLSEVPDDIGGSARGAHSRDAVVPHVIRCKRVVPAACGMRAARVYKSPYVLLGKPSVRLFGCAGTRTKAVCV